MQIIVHYTISGVSAVGLNPLPTIKIYRTFDSFLEVNEASLVEIGDGLYKYNFTVPTDDIEYCWRVICIDTSLSVYEKTKKGGSFNEHGFQVQDIENKIDIVDTNVDDVETLSNTIDGKVDVVDTVVDSIQIDINSIEPKIDQVINEHTDINTKLDNIQVDLDDPNQYKADITLLALETTSQLIKTETDKIVNILGLVQQNFRIDDVVYSLINNAYRLMSCTIKIYPTIGDTDADTNMITSYDMVSTYDGNGNMLDYKVTGGI